MYSLDDVFGYNKEMNTRKKRKKQDQKLHPSKVLLQDSRIGQSSRLDNRSKRIHIRYGLERSNVKVGATLRPLRWRHD